MLLEFMDLFKSLTQVFCPGAAWSETMYRGQSLRAQDYISYPPPFKQFLHQPLQTQLVLYSPVEMLRKLLGY